ncbi:unknown [Fusobacterium sp. CAG:439]|nr:unknown [Fusobacterium sp. CAG:439]HIT92632.1 hypothetical protein [Candidatus Stercorousia faecigallinarum]
MKKSLIFLSIFIVSLIAFIDAKDRIEELDEVAANTPSQVEMKQMINKPEEQMKYNTDAIKNNVNNNAESAVKKRIQDNQLMQKQQDNVDRRRDSINNTVN